MQTLKKVVRRGLLYVFTVILIGGSPAAVFAQGAADDSTSTKDSASKTEEKDKRTYTYDPETKHWSSDKWKYDAASGTYVPITPPSPPPAPVAPPEAKNQAEASNVPVQNAIGTQTNSVSPQQQAASPSNSEITQNTDLNSDTEINTDTTMANNIDSDAKTGNATVGSNTTAGNAGTGDASAETTVINSVHSTVEGEAAGIAHFTVDVTGDVLGDIVLYPIIDDVEINSTTKVNTTTEINTNTDIDNDINLAATSGNANVTNNTKAGNATTGDAHTVANVMNLINSIIAANKSFVGTINIHGNLNGDILVSPEFIPQLLGNNSSTTSSFDGALSMELNNNQSIINNIKLSAESGNANISNNTTAGAAQTGEAQTNLTVLNLTGREVDAQNSMLVFVNVLGRWVGMIVDSPGATAAALGNDVTKNTTTKLSGSLVANNNSQITNNINLASKSGDANVSNNTTAGNATTGDATASANIANISTSTFQLTDWFGIVFINVFGTWIGSFGVDTASGNVIPLSNPDAPNPARNTNTQAPNIRLGFIPKETSNAQPVASLASFNPSGPTLTAADIPADILDRAKELAIVTYPDRNGLPDSDILGAMTNGVEQPSSEESSNPVQKIALVITLTGIIGTMVFGLARRIFAS